MKKTIKVVLFPFVLLLIVLAYWYFTQYVSISSTNKNIEFIREHFNAKGELIDYQNELNVKSMDDIKLFVKDNKVQIDFGNVKLKWTAAQFVAAENIKALESIYITAYKDKKTNRLRVYYKGQEIQRWVS